MRNQKDFFTGFFKDLPWFFKAYVAGVIFVAVGIAILIGYVGYSIASDPGQLGRVAGEIANGYAETTHASD